MSGDGDGNGKNKVKFCFESPRVGRLRGTDIIVRIL